jgi:circadian clock protein KaiC
VVRLKALVRVRSGIEEFDRIVGGGFVKGSTNMVAGGPGTGKTIFAAQFIFNGVVQFSEKGVYASFTESSEMFKQYMFELGWDFYRLEDEGYVRILDFVPLVKDSFNSSFDVIFEEARTLGAKRLVIDSISTLFNASRPKSELRTTISVIQKLLKRLDCTSILITEIPWGDKGLSSGIEEFVADGIILLETLPVNGELRRRLTVPKMRGTNHEMKFYQYAIAKEHGIVLTPYPEVV